MRHTVVNRYLHPSRTLLYSSKCAPSFMNPQLQLCQNYGALVHFGLHHHGIPLTCQSHGQPSHMCVPAVRLRPMLDTVPTNRVLEWTVHGPPWKRVASAICAPMRSPMRPHLPELTCTQGQDSAAALLHPAVVEAPVLCCQWCHTRLPLPLPRPQLNPQPHTPTRCQTNLSLLTLAC